MADPNYPLGRRELQADFDAAVPGLGEGLSTTRRPDALTFDYLRAFSLGPRDVADLTNGPTARPWYVRCDNVVKKVFVARANDANTAWEVETELFSFVGDILNEIDVAFEQQGRPVVCAERTVAGVNEIWLYWFKPSAGTFVFEKITDGRTPRVLLDNPPDTTNSDIELFYLKPASGLFYRVQRETYAMEHATPHTEETAWFLEDVFYTVNWRVACILSQRGAGGVYAKKRLETTLMPVFLKGEAASTASVAMVTIDEVVALIVLSQDSLDFAETTPTVVMQSIIDELPLIFHTLFDHDESTPSVEMRSMDDVSVQIFHTLFDHDESAPTLPVMQSINDVVAVISHTLFDHDESTPAVAFLSIDNVVP